MKDGKTRKVAGVDLNADCFLYAPDLENTSGWLFPVLVRGDEDKTRNLIVMHLHNFDARTTGLPCELRQELFDMLRGCAISHGVRADRRVFTTNVAPTPTLKAEPVPVRTKPLKKDLYVEQVVAEQDRRCNELLRSLGLE